MVPFGIREISFWDTHVHIFNSEQFPFKLARSYTPQSASVESLLAKSKATNFLLVQATIEDGHLGLLYHVSELSAISPNSIIRAAILYEEGESWTDEYLESLRVRGVRVLRYHAAFGNTKDTASIVQQLHNLLEGRLSYIARNHGWSISFQLPQDVWHSITLLISEQKYSDITFIVEHMGSLRFPMHEKCQALYNKLIRAMKNENIYLKLCALHRRYEIGSEEEIETVVKHVAQNFPSQLLWGSDWPHVDSTPRLQVSQFLPIDELSELSWLRRRIPEEAFTAMLTTNPAKLLL
jgi:predicted TIM-barrel fold metal-dependent hydrolase